MCQLFLPHPGTSTSGPQSETMSRSQLHTISTKRNPTVCALKDNLVLKIHEAIKAQCLPCLRSCDDYSCESNVSLRAHRIAAAEQRSASSRGTRSTLCSHKHLFILQHAAPSPKASPASLPDNNPNPGKLLWKLAPVSNIRGRCLCTLVGSAGANRQDHVILVHGLTTSC